MTDDVDVTKSLDSAARIQKKLAEHDEVFETLRHELDFLKRSVETFKGELLAHHARTERRVTQLESGGSN